jgi:hypothetical protein
MAATEVCMLTHLLLGVMLLCCGLSLDSDPYGQSSAWALRGGNSLWQACTLYRQKGKEPVRRDIVECEGDQKCSLLLLLLLLEKAALRA